MNLVQETENYIKTFYQSQNSEERNRSHQWLLQLQRSQEAWQVSWLLLDSTKSVECQYYGAIILYYKLVNVIDEISKESLEELKGKLITLISTSTNKLILSKLSSVFAALIIQTVSEDVTLLGYVDQIGKFLEGSGCDSKRLILQILTELPAQFKHSHMNANKRLQAREFMSQFVEKLVTTWRDIFENNDINLKLDSLSCMLGWIEFGITISDCIVMVPIILRHIESDDLCPKVCEVISELFTAPSSYSLRDTLFELFSQVLQLEPLIMKAIEEGNEEFVNCTCLMVSTIAETHSDTLIKAPSPSHQHVSLNLSKLIFQFSSINGHFPVDETCSRLTLTFWYNIQDELLSLDEDEFTEYHKQFHQILFMLIDAFFRKAQFPPDDVYRKYNSDEKEQLRCYRIDIQDTIMYLHNRLRDQSLLYFTQKLTQLFTKSATTWQEYESVMFLLSGITSTIDTEDTKHIPNIIQLLKNVPDHPKTKDTMYTFLGGLGEWLNSNPSNISEVLPFLISGLLKKESSYTCSLSLQDICQDCAMLIDPDSVKDILKACKTALLDPSYSSKVIARLFQIIGYMISVLPPANINGELDMIVSPLLQQFKITLQSNNPTPAVYDQICHFLNCFQALYRSLDPFEELNVHPISLVYQQMITVFPLLKGFCMNEVVVVAATGCISKAIEIVRENMTPHMNATCQILYEIFSIHPQASIIDTSSLIVGMFGSEENTMEMINQFYKALVTACLKLSDRGSEFTDCFHAFMEFLVRIMKTVPEFLFNDLDQQMAFIKFSFTLLNFQETPTVKSACNFLTTYIGNAPVYGKDLLLNFGRDLIFQVLLCIGVTAPRHLTDSYAEIIFALKKNNITELSIWLSDVLSTENFPTQIPTNSEKEQFTKAVLRDKTKNRLRETVKKFSLLCRGLQGMPHTS